MKRSRLQQHGSPKMNPALGRDGQYHHGGGDLK
jgi:hypothetical protein